MSAPSNTSLEGFHATATAERADRLVRGFFDAVNAGDEAGIDQAVARSFLSYDKNGVRSRTGIKRYYSALRQSFSDLRFEMHENIGVLVEGDLVALRTIVTGTHVGEYAGVAPTGSRMQTSASHILRVRDDQVVEHWPVMDTYRILVAIGAIPGVANVFQRGLSPAWRNPPRRVVPRAARQQVQARNGTTGYTRGVAGCRSSTLRRCDRDGSS